MGRAAHLWRSPSVPVLTGRDAFGSMREKILAVAPGTRLVPVSADGLADEPLDEVEVLLRGWSLGATRSTDWSEGGRGCAGFIPFRSAWSPSSRPASGSAPDRD